jgi:hypothetical protein
MMDLDKYAQFIGQALQFELTIARANRSILRRRQ